MRLTDEALGAVEFGRFRLLPHRREFRADGVAVELGSRAFDVLMVLTEARGALVTKDEILSSQIPPMGGFCSRHCIIALQRRSMPRAFA